LLSFLLLLCASSTYQAFSILILCILFLLQARKCCFAPQFDSLSSSQPERLELEVVGVAKIFALVFLKVTPVVMEES